MSDVHRAWLRRTSFGHARYVWLLWALAVLVLVCCPMALSDPAMWFYVLDPELLAVFVLIGIQYGGVQLGLTRLWIRAALHPRAHGDVTRRRQTSNSSSDGSDAAARRTSHSVATLSADT